MAKYSVLQVRTEVQRLFGDESQVQLENNDVVRWINMAQREAVLQTEGLLENTFTGNFVSGQQTYVLDSNLFALHRVRVRPDTSTSYNWIRWVNGVDFERIVDGWDGTTSTGLPEVYTEKDRSLVFFPVPNFNLNPGFKYEGSKYPTDVVNDADLIALPEYYNQYIVDYVMMRAYEMDEDLDAQYLKAQTVQATLDFNEGRENYFGRDTYPVVQDYSGDYC